MFSIKTFCICILFLISAFKIRDSKGAETCQNVEAVYSFCDDWRNHNVTYYIECMKAKDYDIRAYVRECSKEVNLPPVLETFCNPKDKETSIKALCCTLVKGIQQQPEKGESYVMDSAQKCIDEMIKQSKNH